MVDSDPRLQFHLQVQQRFRRFGKPMANSLANEFWIAPKLFQYSGEFSRHCLTAGIFAQVGWMTHEHETALPSLPPS